MAIDVANWGVLGEAKFFSYARKYGFTAGYFNGQNGRPKEPWHIIDFDPWGAIPSGDPTTPEEEDMTPEQDARLKNVENMLKVPGQAFGFPQHTYNTLINDTNANIDAIRQGGVDFPNQDYNAFEALANAVNLAIQKINELTVKVDNL
jgi:hypothetical protein